MSEAGARRVEPGEGAKRRIYVVDDHPIVRQGIALFINREPDLEVCGEADSAQNALDDIPALRPDLAIIDISLKGPDGLDLLKSLRARDERLPVLMLSMHDELSYAERALRAGANGFIMKQEAAERVLIAIRRILGGEVYLSDRLTRRMLQELTRGTPVAPSSPVARLSDRELEVFRLVGEGQATRQIADTLKLSVKTVESYQAHIKDKLGLGNARELVRRAVEWVVSQEGT